MAFFLPPLSIGTNMFSRPSRVMVGALLALCYWLAVSIPVYGDEFDSLMVQIPQDLDAGRYQDAEIRCKRLLTIIAANYSDKPAIVGAGLQMLAVTYDKQGRYAEAARVFEQVLSIWNNNLAPDDLRITETQNNLANVYWEEGKYTQAEALYRRVLAIREAKLGRDHLLLAAPLNNLGSVCRDTGQFSEAESLFRRSLAILDKHLESDHPDIATGLIGLGAVYFYQEQYARAEPLLTRALVIRERRLGPNHPYLAMSLQSIGLLYFHENKYAVSETFYQRALAIQELVLGPKHPDVADTLHSLANLYDTQGQGGRAEPLYLRSLEIKEKVNPESPAVALTLYSLASNHVDKQEFDRAEALYRRALEVSERALGPNHPDVARSLTGLANLYCEQQQYAPAIASLQRAQSIIEKAIGPNSMQVAWPLGGLSRVYKLQGDYAQADALINRVATIAENAADMDLQFKCYRERAEVRWKMNRREEALTDLKHALQLAEMLRVNVAGAEKDLAEFFGTYSSAFERMVQWQSELGHVDESFAAVERGRARTLIDQMKLQGVDLLAGVPPEQARALREKEAANRSAVASLEKQLEILPQRKDYDEARKKAEELRLTAALIAARQKEVDGYRSIRNVSPAYRLAIGQDFKPIGLDRLHDWVKRQNAILLEYFLGDEASYLFIVPADGPPQLLKLEIATDQAKELATDAGPLTAGRMKDALRIEGQGLLERLMNVKSEVDRALTQRLAALWKVLIPQTQRDALTSGKYQRLILIPDGPLANLPFDALVVEPAEQPIYFLDRGPPIAAGPSATLLYNLSQRGKNDGKSSVLTVANPIYQSTAQSAANTSDRAGSAQLLSLSQPGTRYGLRGDLRPLPFTGWESSWISQTFRSADIQVGQYLKQKATEKNLREQVGGRQLVHLACHGLVDDEHGNFFGALALTPGSSGEADVSNDGFLTLPEIYELNLKNCELAILSACQTNYGPEQRGEGVWALSRGFLAAGSRRVVASNWLVDDKAAASMVYAFCKKIADQEKHVQTSTGSPASNGENIEYARPLHEAKLWIRKQEQWKSPYFWATFTLIGPN
jgi:CHAT domain-containing protein/Tfp pilus assembly protein PilF